MASRYAFRFFESRGEYIVAVRNGSTVVCVGCEATEAEAEAWGKAACAYHDGKTTIHPKDAWERAGRVANLGLKP